MWRTGFPHFPSLDGGNSRTGMNGSVCSVAGLIYIRHLRWVMVDCPYKGSNKQRGNFTVLLRLLFVRVSLSISCLFISRPRFIFCSPFLGCVFPVPSSVSRSLSASLCLSLCLSVRVFAPQLTLITALNMSVRCGMRRRHRCGVGGGGIT